MVLYGQVIEWLIESDCKSVLKITMVKIHPCLLLWKLKCTGGTQALILMQLYSYKKKWKVYFFRCAMDSLKRFRHEPNTIVKFL